jgi:hypothetical protein
MVETASDPAVKLSVPKKPVATRVALGAFPGVWFMAGRGHGLAWKFR